MTAHVKALGFYSRKDTKAVKKAKAHVKYISADHPRHLEKPELFSRDQDHIERKDVYERLDETPERGVVAHKLVLTVSEDEQKRLGIDMKDLVRDTMNRYEMRNGQRLEWVAAIHNDTGHPHAHIVISGRDDAGKEVGLYKRHIRDFQEIAEQEKTRQSERNRETERGLERDRARPDEAKERENNAKNNKREQPKDSNISRANKRDIFQELELEYRRAFEARQNSTKVNEQSQRKNHKLKQRTPSQLRPLQPKRMGPKLER